MRNWLFLALLLWLSAAAGAMEIGHGIEMDDHGGLRCDGVRVLLGGFNPGWRYFSQEQLGECAVKRTAGGAEVRGVLAAGGATWQFAQTVRPAADPQAAPGFTLQYSLSGGPAELSGLFVEVQLPLDDYVGQEIFADGKTCTLPREFMGAAPMAFPEHAASLVIPTRTGRLEFVGIKDFSLYLQDERQFDGSSYTLRLGVPTGLKPFGGGAWAVKVSFRPHRMEPLSLATAANRGFADAVAGDGQGGWTDQGPENDWLFAISCG